MKSDHDDVAADAAPDAKSEVAAKPAADAEKPAADAEKPAADAEKPAADADEPVKADEPAKAEQPAKPAEEPTAEAGKTEAGKTEAKAEKTEVVDALTGKPVEEPDATADSKVPSGKTGDDESDEDAGGKPSSTEPSGAASGGGIGALFPPKTTKARILVAALVVVLIGLATGGYLWYRSSSASLPGGVAFRADGVNVTERDLDDQVQTLGALYGVQPPTEGDRLDKFHRDVAKSTALSMVVDNAAVERKVAVADRQASDFLSRYVASQYGEGQAGRDAFVKDLADKGTSEPKVLAEVKRQLTLKLLYEQVTSDVTVTDADVRQTFDQRKAEFATPERREIHNVVVQTKEQADAVAAQVKAGTPIETIAQQQSIDDSTKASGGNLGLVSAAELQKSYADAAFSTPVGGFFGPIETQKTQGTVFNVGKVVQSQPGAPADFDKIKDGVRQLVISERGSARWHDFLVAELEDAKVVYADKYQPPNPDEVPTAPGPADSSGGQGSAPAAPAPAAPAPAAPAPAPVTPPK
jgi:peptidyl-prolyl cis-trans isomerase C